MANSRKCVTTALSFMGKTFIWCLYVFDFCVGGAMLILCNAGYRLAFIVFVYWHINAFAGLHFKRATGQLVPSPNYDSLECVFKSILCTNIYSVMMMAVVRLFHNTHATMTPRRGVMVILFIIIILRLAIRRIHIYIDICLFAVKLSNQKIIV